MRQLFLPACVCLVTWSGPTASEPKMSLQNFTGASAPRKILAHVTAEPDLLADAIVLEVPKSSAAVPADLAIEYPAPSGDVETTKPETAPLPPVAKPVVARSSEEICDTLAAAARHNDLPVPFFIRLLFQESRFRAGVVSPAGAQGIAQFMPDTAAGMGLKNPFDPLQAIPASARLLRSLIQRFGNLGLAAAAYNAGPKRVVDWLEKKGTLPSETLGYVKTITGRPIDNWKAAAARHPEQRLPRRAPCQEEAGLHAWNAPQHIPLPAPSPLPVRSAKAAHSPAAKNAKASVRTVAQQLAARRHKPRHKPQRTAQR